ncbi:MAG TPA: M56 family metallopeptidase [Chthonomonadaceae bacterium]|nr:M56 family metallopeptidase [Chthonomonadaceae bacterium]
MKSLILPDPAALTAFALNVLLLLTVVCLVALIAARCVFRHNPSLRYSVCLAGLVGILLSPPLVCLQNRVGVSLLTLPLPEHLSLSPVFLSPVSPTLMMSTGTAADVHGASELQTWMFWVLWGVFSAWVTGVVWGSVRFVRGLRAALRLTNRIRPWSAAAHDAMLPQVERVLGCSLPPVFTSQHVESPVSVGLFRPLVILPEGLPEALSPTQLRHVLLHECAHIAFRHTFGGLVERVVRLLFWPHPLVSALCRELARAREEVCDNVASQEDGAACYARTLLAIAQGVFPAPNISSSLALLGPETSLEERITGLLHPRRNRMVRVKRGTLWAVTGVVVCTVASTVAIRVVAAEGNAKQAAARASIAAELADRRQAAANPLTPGIGMSGAPVGGIGGEAGSSSVSSATTTGAMMGSNSVGGGEKRQAEAIQLAAGKRVTQTSAGHHLTTTRSRASHAARPAVSGDEETQSAGNSLGGGFGGGAPQGMAGGGPGGATAGGALGGAGNTGGEGGGPGGAGGGGFGGGSPDGISAGGAGGGGAGVGPGLSPGGPGGGSLQPDLGPDIGPDINPRIGSTPTGTSGGGVVGGPGGGIQEGGSWEAGYLLIIVGGPDSDEPAYEIERSLMGIQKPGDGGGFSLSTDSSFAQYQAYPSMRGITLATGSSISGGSLSQYQTYPNADRR